MGRVVESDKKQTRSTPSRTPEAKESKCISLAYNLAEQHLREGTATSQEICHFLKLGTAKEELENEKLRSDLRVADAKIKQMEQSTANNDVAEKAIEMFKSYSGQRRHDPDEFY